MTPPLASGPVIVSTSWTNYTAVIEWQESQHGAVAAGSYIKIGTAYYLVSSSGPSATAGNVTASLWQCDQATGASLGPTTVSVGFVGQPLTFVDFWPVTTTGGGAGWIEWSPVQKGTVPSGSYLMIYGDLIPNGAKYYRVVTSTQECASYSSPTPYCSYYDPETGNCLNYTSPPQTCTSYKIMTFLDECDQATGQSLAQPAALPADFGYRIQFFETWPIPVTAYSPTPSPNIQWSAAQQGLLAAGSYLKLEHPLYAGGSAYFFVDSSEPVCSSWNNGTTPATCNHPVTEYRAYLSLCDQNTGQKQAQSFTLPADIVGRSIHFYDFWPVAITSVSGSRISWSSTQRGTVPSGSYVKIFGEQFEGGSRYFKVFDSQQACVDWNSLTMTCNQFDTAVTSNLEECHQVTGQGLMQPPVLPSGITGDLIRFYDTWPVVSNDITVTAYTATPAAIQWLSALKSPPAAGTYIKLVHPMYPGGSHYFSVESSEAVCTSINYMTGQCNHVVTENRAVVRDCDQATGQVLAGAPSLPADVVGKTISFSDFWPVTITGSIGATIAWSPAQKGIVPVGSFVKIFGSQYEGGSKYFRVTGSQQYCTGWTTPAPVCDSYYDDGMGGYECGHYTTPSPTCINYEIRTDLAECDQGTGQSAQVAAALPTGTVGSSLQFFDTWPIIGTTPVNGSCGTSNGGAFAAAPTTGLCSTGTPSPVGGSGPWSWSCNGVNGGTSASCATIYPQLISLPGSITSDPAISDLGEVVWLETRDGYDQVISSRRGQLTFEAVQKTAPSVNSMGDVLWMESVWDGANSLNSIKGIIRGEARTLLTSTANVQLGNINDHGEFVYRVWDGTSEQIYSNVRGLLISERTDILSPSISNNGDVAWSQYVFPGYSQIFKLPAGGTTPLQMTDTPYFKDGLAISDGEIVWSGLEIGRGNWLFSSLRGQLPFDTGVMPAMPSVNSCGDVVFDSNSGPELYRLGNSSPCSIASEPNNTQGEATPVTLGKVVKGILDSATNQEDWYRFEANSGDVIDVFINDPTNSISLAIPNEEFTSTVFNGRVRYTITPAYSGTHYLQLLAGPGRAGYALSIDKPDVSGPAVTITAPLPGQRVQDTVLVQYTALDRAGVPTLQVLLDGVPVTAASGSQLDLMALPDGEHTLTVTAVDSLGNQSSASVVLLKDTLSPVVTITSPLPGSFSNNSTPLLTYSVNEPYASLAVLVNGVESASVPGSPIGPLVDGEYTVAIYATDLAGNVGTATSVFAIDTVSPTAIVVMDKASLKSGDVATVTFVFSEPVRGFDNSDVTVEHGTWGAVASIDGGTTWTATLTPHNGIEAVANITLLNSDITDLAGNTVAGLPAYSYLVDTRPPAPTIALNPATSDNIINSAESSSAVMITGTVGGDAVLGDSITLAVNNQTYGGMVSGDNSFSISVDGRDLENAADSTITVTVTSVDQAGNAGTASAAIRYTIDTVRPTATISVSDAALKIADITPVSIMFNETVSGFSPACLTVPDGSLADLAPVDTTTWVATLTPVMGRQSASNRITLDNSCLVDAAGNSGAGTSSSSSYAVDTLSPTVTGATYLGSTLVELFFSEPVIGALDPAHFTLSNGLTVLGVEKTPDSYRLTTSHQVYGASYTATVAGITDQAGNPVDSGASIASWVRTGNNPPTIPGQLAPLPATEIAVFSPELQVMPSIDSDDDTANYLFEVASDPGFATIVATGTSGASPTWTVPVALNDNSVYYWRTLASDGNLNSSYSGVYSFFVNSVNDPPSAVVVSSPPAGGEVTSLTPQLTVSNAADVDQDTLVYQFEVAMDPTFTTIVAATGNQAAGAAVTTWTVSTPLQDNADYYWRARAIDSHGAVGGWSAGSPFFVNTANDQPSAPVINAPSDRNEVATVRPLLSVNRATDVDRDWLTYVFEIDRVAGFSSESKQTSFPLSGTDNVYWSPDVDLGDNTTWYWRVRASDGTVDSNWMTTASLFVNLQNDPPSAPAVNNPANSSRVTSTGPTLSLYPATDMDNDVLTYEYEVYSDSALTTPVAHAEGEGTAWVVTPPLSDNTTYFWRARARDEHAAAGNWLAAVSFFVNNNGYNDPPTISIVSPGTGEPSTGGASYAIRWVAADPDSNPVISLSYDTVGQGQNGTLITTGIHKDDTAGSYTWDISTLADGTYWVYGTVADEATTVHAYSQAPLVIDRTPQTRALPAGGSFRTAQSVVLTASENATIYYTLDGSTPTTSSLVYVAPIAVTSSRTLRFFALDGTGHSEQVRTEQYLIDTVPPTVSLSSPTAGFIRSTNPLLAYSISDGTVVVRLDGSVIATTSGGLLPTLGQGNHTVRVEATDAVGNVAAKEVSFTVDTVPPALSITQIEMVTTATAQTVSGTRESGCTLTATANSTATIGSVSYPSATTWSVPVSALIPGDNGFIYTLTDTAGNKTSVAATIRYNVPPTSTSATITVADNSVSSPVVPSVVDPTGGATFMFAILTQPAHGSASVVNNKLIYTPAANYFGPDSFGYTATADSGLSVNGIAQVYVSGTTPLAVTGLLALSQPDRSIRLTWNGSTSPDIDRYRVYWDNGTGTVSYATPLAVVTHPATQFQTGPLSDAVYKFVIRSEDSSGLLETNTTVTSARVDTAPPAPVAAVNGSLLTGNRIAVSWPASVSADAKSYLLYSDDGTGTVNYDSPLATLSASTLTYASSALNPANSYRFAVITEDGNGNRSPATVSAPMALSYPDLAVTNVTWAPTSFMFGDTVQFTATVTNTGQAPTGTQGFALGYYLDDVLFFQELYREQIQPGASATIVSSKRLLVTARTYALKVVADSLNSQVETSRTNNTFTAGTFAITADYLVAAVVDKSAYTAGAAVNIRSQVANSSASTSYFSDSDVSVTATLTDSADVIKVSAIPLVYATGDKSFTTALQLPANLPTGNYLLKVTATGTQSGVSKSTILSIGVVEGVTLSVQSSAARYYLGDPITLTGSVGRAGGTPFGGAVVTLELKVNGMTTLAKAIADADGSYSHTYQPPKGVGGAFAVIARTGANQLMTEAQTGFTVEGLYLSPSGINIPNVSKNMPVTLAKKVRLQNMGTEQVTGIQLVLEDAVSDDSVTGSITNTALPSVLAPGSSVDLDLAFTSGLAAPQTADFSIRASADGLPAANSPSVPIRLGLVDPTPTPVVLPNQFTIGIAPGGSALKQFTFKNGGYGALHNVRVVSPGMQWITIVGGEMGILQPGESRQFDMVISPSANEMLGTYQIPLTIASDEISDVMVRATITVTLSDKGSIDFIVTDDGGMLVPDATVSLTSLRDYLLQTPTGTQIYKNIVRATTDATGVAHFTTLDSGEYNYEIDAKNHNTVMGHVAITPGLNKPDVVANMTANWVSMEWTVTPTTVTDHYNIDATMTMVVNQASVKPVLFLNPVTLHLSLAENEELSGNLSLLTPNNVNLANVAVDATQLRQHGVDFVFLQPGGVASPVINVETLPAQTEILLPYRVRLLPGASLIGRNLGIISASASYPYTDPLTNELKTGTATGFTSVRYLSPPVVAVASQSQISASANPPAIFMSEYCKGWFQNAVTNGFVNNTATVRVTNTGTDAITLSPAYGITAEISALDLVMNKYAVGAFKSLWEFINSGNPLQGVGSLWEGSFMNSSLAPGESTDLLLNEYDPTLVGINLPDAGIKGGIVLFSYSNGIQVKPHFIPVAVTQICTNGISIPVVQTVPGPTGPGISGGGGEWSTSWIGGGGGPQLPPDFNKINLPTALPTADEPDIIKIRLSQDAALEREIFMASLELTPLIADMSNVRIDLLVRDRNSQSSKIELFNVVDSGERSIAAIVKGQEISEKWTILPREAAGGDTLDGVQYEVGARISFTTNGVTKTVETEYAPITVKPEPSLTLDYYLRSAVDAEEPFQVGVKVTNSGKGIARNFRINSAHPVITENTGNVPASFVILGSGMAGQYQTGQNEILFGDIQPGQTVRGSWTIKSSVRGDFTDFKATLTHQSPAGLPLSDLITQVNTHLIPSGHKYATIDPRMIDAQSKHADPVDTSSGAHLMDRSLLRVQGARLLDFSLSYNSLLTADSPVGRGWGHNHEAALTREEDGSVAIRWSANRRNSFYRNSASGYASTEGATRFDSLIENQDGSFVLQRKDGTKYTFDPAGQLSRQVNRTGQPLDYAYDGSGRLSTITEPVSGKSIMLAYSAGGRVETLTDPLNRQVRLVYDPGTGDLVEITDAANRTMTYAYTGEGRMLSATARSANPAEVVQLFENTYDAAGRVHAQDDAVAGNPLTYFTYDDVLENGAIKHISRVVDRNGSVKVMEHDSSYRLISTTDHLGKKTSYEYDAAGNRVKLVDPNGNMTRYDFDERGNMTRMTDPQGRQSVLAYDGRDNLISITNHAGKRVTYEYDTLNRLTAITDQMNRMTRYTYNAHGQLADTINPDNTRIVNGYENGILVSVKDALANMTAYESDAAGRVTRITSPSGAVTQLEYDAVDNVITMIDPLNRETVVAYDNRNNRLNSTDPRGYITRFQYNGNNKLISVENPLKQVSTFEYDPEDRLVKTTDPRGNSVTTSYDAVGRAETLADALGNRVKVAYNAVDQVTERKDAYDRTILQNSYDPVSNQLLTVKDALQNTVRYEYDSLDRRNRVIDPSNRVRSFEYDDLNRIIAVTDPKNGVSRQAFDAAGNLRSITDPNSNTTTFNYDSARRQTGTVMAAGGTRSTEFSGDRVLSSTNARGQTTEYTYYADGRIQSSTDPSGTVVYTYDENGNVLTVDENGASMSYTYDELNRVSSYTDGFGNRLRYAYDAAGNLASLTYPDSKVVIYGYDAANRMISVTDWNSRVTTYEYDRNSRLTKTVRPNGSTETRVYDLSGRLTELKDAKADGASLVSWFEFAYDPSGNVISEVNHAIPETPLPANLSTMTYGADNRLATYNGQAVRYDDDGNMVNGPLMTETVPYGFDSRNRLTSAGGVTYRYDAANNRISQVSNGIETRYAVNPAAPLSQVLVDSSSTGSRTAYVYGLGLIGREDADGNYIAYHYDRRGSTIALSNMAGTVTDSYTYGPYAELVAATGETHNPFRYNGRDGVLTDENGLYYMRARYFNPTIKRFVNQDVVLGGVDDARSLNRFAYVNGNPVDSNDPYGLSADSDDGWNNVYLDGANKGYDIFKDSVSEMKDYIDKTDNFFDKSSKLLAYRGFKRKHIAYNVAGNLRGMVSTGGRYYARGAIYARGVSDKLGVISGGLGKVADKFDKIDRYITVGKEFWRSGNYIFDEIYAKESFDIKGGKICASIAGAGIRSITKLSTATAKSVIDAAAETSLGESELAKTWLDSGSAFLDNMDKTADRVTSGDRLYNEISDMVN